MTGRLLRQSLGHLPGLRSLVGARWTLHKSFSSSYQGQLDYPCNDLQPSNTLNINCCDFSDEVLAALAEKRPVVALESTIITHGMPFPVNVATATEVEEIIRKEGAVPATIAIVGGRIKIGLSPETLEFLGDSASEAVKTSYRDLHYVLSQKKNGGTTVSATIAIAQSVRNLSVMVTGGIGGVHRGGEASFDISADLIQLGRTPIGVVCSGVKSILDIERTLEYLETQRVCVTTLGPTGDFPAFYSRDSGFKSPHHLKSVTDAAQLLFAMKSHHLGSGAVIAVPVPEEHAIPRNEIGMSISAALADAQDQGIKGKEITPFVLAKVAEASEGRSLKANIALIKNNAKIGAQIAKECTEITKKQNKKKSTQKAHPKIVSNPVATSTLS